MDIASIRDPKIINHISFLVGCQLELERAQGKLRDRNIHETPWMQPEQQTTLKSSAIDIYLFIVHSFNLKWLGQMIVSSYQSWNLEVTLPLLSAVRVFSPESLSFSCCIHIRLDRVHTLFSGQ